ncbi:hypothetical protein ARAM_001130 [Aspergillus rambellii]|uniref:Dienelactone hydrolase domain-containing protein n=1 Tax=Aspergillus rambellii TaxID=308745 RepID=A0A0F8XU34_9EURO|nr:hypothetical protein ARAM_001130 [Aspergillus rambellii]
MSCPDCFSGHIHEGTPKGSVTTLHGLNVYVAEPSGDPAHEIKGIVVIIPDAFGWDFVNNRLLADNYAEKGKYKLYTIEKTNITLWLLAGTAAPVWALDSIKAIMKTGSLYDWIIKPQAHPPSSFSHPTPPQKKNRKRLLTQLYSYHIAWAMYGMIPFIIHNRPGKSYPLVKSFFEALRRNEGARLPIGAAGFCWGGKHTVLLARGAEINGESLINAGFTGHPSFLDIPGDIEKLKLPVSFALGELDSNIRMPQIQQIQQIMESKEGEVKVYVGAGHGFCVRADMAADNVERQAVESEDQAVDFFNRYLTRVSFD